MAEARKLVQTINKNFLECAICFEPLRDPRALPCQHGFCRDCLEQCLEASEDKHSLVCPTCHKVVTIPKGVEGLPVHFLVSSLQETVDIMQKEVPKPSKDTPCSNCNDPAKVAKVRCLDCKRYFCDTCHASHETLKTIMKDHRVVSMEDILSGKVSLSQEDEDKCATHGEVYKYYCETDGKPICQGCVILKECPAEHNRITLEKAVQNLSTNFEELLNKCSNTLVKYEKSIQAITNVRSELEIYTQLAKGKLTRLKKEYNSKVEEVFEKHENEIDRIKMKRIAELDKNRIDLESAVQNIQKTKEDATRIMKMGSKYELITSHLSLSNKLQTLSKLQPPAVNKAQGYVKFEAAAIPVIPPIGNLSTGKDGTPGERWSQIEQFSTPEFNELRGLTINQNGDIAVTSSEKGVKVFSRSGKLKCIFKDCPEQVMSIAVCPSNNYIIDGIEEFLEFDYQGNRLCSTPLNDTENKLSNANSVAVDSSGKIIAGLVSNTISIHNADGSLISRFATQRTLYRLAVTSNGEIVGSFCDSDELDYNVQLMDYTGCNVRVIQPPTEVKAWSPGGVCCRKGEIFVSNERKGDPRGIYRYTAEGNYLGCVTTEVSNPRGIALTQDGMELLVADSTADNYVKIFQRP